MFLTVNFTLARLASDFKFTLANRKFHSPWRVFISSPAFVSYNIEQTTVIITLHFILALKRNTQYIFDCIQGSKLDCSRGGPSGPRS